MIPKLWKYSVIILALFSLLSCARDRDVREWEYMPDMYRSPAVKPQEDNPDDTGHTMMRHPVANTIPRDMVPYPHTVGDTLAAHRLINPLRPGQEVLALGQEYYAIYCYPCHGSTGAGDGPIIPKMTKPPLLYTDKAIGWPDGRFYHILTMGQGNMPSYKSSIDQNTRWAIIHYVRALQKAARPTQEDIDRLKDLGYSEIPVAEKESK
jgi:mono/diheme cytochrome c family protein